MFHPCFTWSKWLKHIFLNYNGTFPHGNLFAKRITTQAGFFSLSYLLFWGRFEASDLGGWHGTGWYDLHAERNNSPGRKGVPGLMRRGRIFISVSEEKASYIHLARRNTWTKNMAAVLYHMVVIMGCIYSFHCLASGDSSLLYIKVIYLAYDL